MRPLKNMCEVAIVGGGLAGLSAARHAARLGRLVTLFEGSGLIGGQLATVNEVLGLPLPGRISGQDLALHLKEDARKVGVQFVESNIATLSADQRLTLCDQDNRTYHPYAVVIASGASLRKLGIPREEELTGRGISHCADCDGAFYRDQDVVVVGGGDAAIHEALVLAKSSRRVFMVCRSALRAKREYIDKLAAKENVQFNWDSEVSAILGDESVSGVRVRNLRTGMSSDIECAGVFPFIGVSPNSAFAPPAFLTSAGYISTNADFTTMHPRIFAVGAVRAGYGGNVIEAMAEGIGAAESAARSH
jgi:thioredoxin reductase (NADPH)